MVNDTHKHSGKNDFILQSQSWKKRPTLGGFKKNDVQNKQQGNFEGSGKTANSCRSQWANHSGGRMSRFF
jgi:hypothetical protein